MDEKFYQRGTYRDINFETGGKTTGQISYTEKLQALLNSLTVSGDQFDRELCARVIDTSKWNGVIDWIKAWSKVDGVVSRLGYGGIMDQKFRQVVIPGFKMPVAAERYRGLYHYMNTGVSASNQIDLVLRAIDMLDGEIDGFWTDIEGAYNEMSSSAFRQNPLAIMRAVRKAYPDIAVGFYTNGTGWKALGKPVGWTEEFLFWYAWYPFNATRFPAVPEGLSLDDIYMWQYSADGNGLGSKYGMESSAVDMNVTRDAQHEFFSENKVEAIIDQVNEIIEESEMSNVSEQLKNEAAMQKAAVDEAYAVIEETLLVLRTQVENRSDTIISLADGVSDAPTVAPLYEATVSASAGLNVRSGPGLSYDKIDGLVNGSAVEVYAEQEADGLVWAKLDPNTEYWVAAKFLV